MKRILMFCGLSAVVAAAIAGGVNRSDSARADDKAPPSSYAPVVIPEPFPKVVERMTDAKPGLAKKQQTLLAERYDLKDKPAPDVMMSRGKPVQGGVRVRLA